MPHYDVIMTAELSMRVDAFSDREAMGIVIAQCYAPIEGRIIERCVDVLAEQATLAKDA